MDNTLINKINLINYIAAKLGRRVTHARALYMESKLGSDELTRLAIVVKTGNIKV